MTRIIRGADFRIESGRAVGGKMFVRVVHIPTNTSRMVPGLDGRPYDQVVSDLISEVVQAIETDGWQREAE
jgi:hypothetical protein